MSAPPSPRPPVRLWPGVVAAGLIVVLRFIVPRQPWTGTPAVLAAHGMTAA